MFKRVAEYTSPCILAVFCIFIICTVLTRNSLTSFDTSANNVSDSDLDICPNITVGLNEFYLLPNISVFIKQYNLTLDEELYVIRDGSVIFCKQYADGRNKLETLQSVNCLTKVGFIISITSLLIQMTILWFVDDLRKFALCNKLLHGIILIFVALFIVYLQTDQIETDKYYVLPTLTHFYLLASVTWMSVISSEAFVYLPNYVRSLHIFGARAINTDHTWNNIFATVIMVTYINLETLCRNNITERYSPKSEEGWCWLLMKSPSQSNLIGHAHAFMIINVCMHYCSLFGFKRITFERNVEEFRKKVRFDYKCSFVVSIAAYVVFVIGVLAEFHVMSWMWNVFIVFVIIEIVISILISMSCVGTTFYDIIGIASTQPLRPTPVNEFENIRAS